MVRKERVNLCLDDILVGLILHRRDKTKGGQFALQATTFAVLVALLLLFENSKVFPTTEFVQCRPFRRASTRIFQHLCVLTAQSSESWRERARHK